MRTEGEITTLLAEIHGQVNVTAKRRLDRDLLLNTLSMVGVLEWVLGMRGDKAKLIQCVQLEVATALYHANRPENPALEEL